MTCTDCVLLSVAPVQRRPPWWIYHRHDWSALVAAGTNKAPAAAPDTHPSTHPTNNSKSKVVQEAVEGRIILSDSPTQWLTDAMVGNALELEKCLPGTKLNYPIGKSTMMGNFMVSRAMRKRTTGQDTMLTSMVQIFGAHSHWHAIIFAFKARVLYYFEPYGSMMSANDTIRKHFDNVLKPQEWRLTSLPLRLQTDGHSWLRHLGDGGSFGVAPVCGGESCTSVMLCVLPANTAATPSSVRPSLCPSLSGKSRGKRSKHPLHTRKACEGEGRPFSCR